MERDTMNAARDQERVESRPRRAGDVGLHPVADGQNPPIVDRSAARSFRERQRAPVNRQVRLARVNDLSAQRLESGGQRASAIDRESRRDGSRCPDWRRSSACCGPLSARNSVS